MTIRRLALRILYWLLVLAVSLALLVALVLFIESRDPTRVGSVPQAAPLASVAH
ncbi:hypothetical protein JDY09_03235 [Thermoleophilum album]|uniref:hypothetical protein n=1 Tax=Thermoleophilum album TaxID=29539 RepID=UPI00237CD397|nr:hypothetical protein [Thermoleophilum album]MCL6440942.1 hypothetical protein [Thermoleophilum sp.]WDT94280.1 hypothetical protein JDY09_03235 [Thermoleophilum album]